MAAKWWRAGAVKSIRALASSPTSLSKAASIHTIQAIPREVTGRRVAARDRAQGRIPGVVFRQRLVGNSQPGRRSDSTKVMVTTERRQIQAIMNSVKPPYFCTTRFPFEIRAGSGSSILLESGTVLPIKIYRDEETGSILNLMFVWANEGMELKVNVPIVFKGEDASPGLRKGGELSRIQTSIKCVCPAEHIPKYIEVDVSNLDIGDRILIHDVVVHPEVKLLSTKEELPICQIASTKSKNPESEGDSVASQCSTD